MKKRHMVLALFMSAMLAVSLGGCSPDKNGSSGGAPAGTDQTSDSTLTKSSLPTEVGVKWTTLRSDGDATPLQLDVKGPWRVTPGSDWRTETHEIVAPEGVPGIAEFSDYTYVMKNTSDGDVYYYPRQVTDEWVLGMGRIHVDGEQVTTEPSSPGKFWPLQLEVGQSYPVFSDSDHTTAAKVLARNTVDTPAGTIENSYLVRFRTESTSAEDEPNDYYYLFAPNVGMVAYFSKLTGDEESGFTAAGSIVVVASLPAK